MWSMASFIYSLFIYVVIGVLGRWYHKKTSVVGPVEVGEEGEADGVAVGNEEQARVAQRRKSESMLIEAETQNNVLEMFIRMIINNSFVTLIKLFVIYCTLFRRNDDPWMWSFILVGLLAVQFLVIHPNTQLTGHGLKFIQNAFTVDPNPNTWPKRINRWYQRNLDPKSDGGRPW